MTSLRAMHHQHIRTRAQKPPEPYPSKQPIIRLLDSFVLIGGFVGPLLSIPQLWNIWADHNVAGVSIVSWGLFIPSNAILLLYGIVHREKAIAITGAGWVIFDSLIVLGVLLYR